MKIRDIAATSLGNVIEWFDFGLFIYLAPILGKNFFHASSTTSANIFALGVFAAGYVCRPLGGILFGYFGDTTGRASSLRYSMLLMSAATLCAGLLPTFGQLGITASILFTLLRMLQGVAAGGEYSGVLIYLAESAPVNKRGFITSLASSGSNLGFMLATLVIILLNISLPSDLLLEWGWRIPFIFLGLLSTIIFYFRLKLTETSTFSYMRETKHVEQKPLLAAIKFAPFSLLKIFGLTCMSSNFYIFYYGYLSQYLPKYSSISFLQSLTFQSIQLAGMLFLIPIGGMLGDRFGRRNLLFITCSLMIITMLPAFHLLISATDKWIIFLTLSMATLLSSLDQGNNLAAFVENSPIDIRYSGIGFAYNLGNAVFGGTAPLMFTLLIANYGKLAPAYYLLLCGFVTLGTITTLLNKKAIENVGFFSH